MANQVLGPERALMISPNKAGQFVKGSGNIDAKLAQGWTIVDSERNHLLPGRVNGHAQDPKEQNGVPIGLDPAKSETQKALEVQERPRRKRRARA